MQNKNATQCLRLGEEYFKSGRFKEAVEQFQEYIWLNPNDPAGHHSLGMAYSELGEFAQAVDPFFASAETGVPNFSEVYHTLGLVYNELQQHANAVRAFQNAIRLEPGSADNHCGLTAS